MPARVSVFINTMRVICVSLLPLHSLAPLPSSASRESVKDCRSALWAPAQYLLVLTPILTLVPFTDSFLYSYLAAGGHLANFAIKRFGIQRGVRRVFGHWSFGHNLGLRTSFRYRF